MAPPFAKDRSMFTSRAAGEGDAPAAARRVAASGAQVRRQLDRREGHLRRADHVAHPQPFAGRVDVAHPGAEVHDLEPAPVEDVGVAAAAHAGRRDRAAGAGGRLGDEAHDRRVVGDDHRLVRGVDGDLDARVGVTGGGLLEAAAHVRGLGREPGRVVAAHLGAHRHLVGHDVGRAPAVYDADVRGRLGVDPSEAHGDERLGRDADRAHALLGRHARVRCPPAHDRVDVVRTGGTRERAADRVAVEHEAPAGAEAPDVEVLRAEEAELLADREDDVEGRVAEPSLAADADALADDRHARLVVAAEDGLPVAADHVVLDEGADALARADGVHVRAEEQRRRVGGAGDVRDQVAGLAADGDAGVVEPDLRAELSELAGEARRDPALAAGEAVDPDQLEEERLQPRTVDHRGRAAYHRRRGLCPAGGPRLVTRVASERILVAGAGALGSVIGGLLAVAGLDVTLLGRRPHLDAARAGGLVVDGLFGTHRVLRGLTHASEPRELADRYAAIFLTVKAYDTATMAAAVARHLDPDGFLVSLQNGLGNVEAAGRAVGPARVLGARVIFGAELVAPGHARVTVFADPVLIGSPDPSDGRRTAAAARCATTLAAAGVPAEPTDEILAALWAKVFYNAALNPLGALLGLRYGELPLHRDTRAIMDTVIEEAFAVARAEEVGLHWRDAAEYREEFYGRLVPSTAEHRPSMLQDIERGRPTEIDAINGEVASRGAQHGIPAPVNATLTRLIRARAARRHPEER